MKIITWNCNGAFRQKYHLLDRFNADVLVIQECEDPARSTDEYREWASNYLWIGENKNKGLAVFAQKKYDIERLEWEVNRLQSFLPVKINQRLILLAVWTKQAGSKHFGYIGQLWKYLQLHKKKLVSDTILCGDLNSSAIWHDHECWWNHLDVVRELEEINLHSLYHRYFSEYQGKEKQPTLYMHRKLEKAYHIDYIFAHESIMEPGYSIEVGRADEWLKNSDHMPVIATISNFT